MDEVEIKEDVYVKKTKKKEFEFYSDLDDPKNEFYGENQKIKLFIPKCIQTLQNSNKEYFVTLENLLQGMKNPNITDIKLGKITFDKETSNQVKQEK